MKKVILLVAILMIMVSNGFSQNIEYTNQVTVEWDAVAPIEPTDIVTYRVYTNSDMLGIAIIGDTDLLQYTITFTIEGEYIIGVSALREAYFPGFTETVESDINWSNVDVPVGSTPIPFVVRHIEGIPSPEGLRLQ